MEEVQEEHLQVSITVVCVRNLIKASSATGLHSLQGPVHINPGQQVTPEQVNNPVVTVCREL